MQFFMLLVANLLMGAIFYLVISLKLEKSATEFREKRLRREMEAMIKEFNATAERNIGILENRISVMRRLMAMTGELKSLDVTVGDDADDNVGEAEARQRPASDAAVNRQREDDAPVGQDTGGLKKGLRILAEKLYTRLHAPQEPTGGADEVGHGNEQFVPEPSGFDDDNANLLIQRELGEAARTPAPVRVVLSDDDIAFIVSTADSRNTLVTLLSERGCDADDISRYSGIPLGEVKLVLNLNNTRP